MKKYKKSYKDNKFKISGPTWNEKLEIPDGAYSTSDIQNYFKHIIKNHETDNPQIRIYVKKNRTQFYI